MTIPLLAIIIPANNEANHIEACLNSVLLQKGLEKGVLEVIVAANGCRDETVALSREFKEDFLINEWILTVLDISTGSKIGALNIADSIAKAPARAYLDADVVLAPELIKQVLDALSHDSPVYVTGRMHLVKAKSWVSRQYGKLWLELPFMRPGNAAGAGFFAVNAAGRARWDLFPDIISDDGFVRGSFKPQERIEVSAGYTWPLVEGFKDLVKVRRRQNAGGQQLRRLYPKLGENDASPSLTKTEHLKLFINQPIPYLVYVFVLFVVRSRSGDENQWARGKR